MDKLINAKPGDISYSLAMSAHRGISFVPEKRARQEQESYVAFMDEVAEKFEQWRTDENEAAMREDLERFRVGYLARLNAKLHADSRTMSSMIAGPSNFPTRSNQKKVDIAHRRLEELLEYREKVLKKIRAKYDPVYIAAQPIRSDDDGALGKLREKLAKHEAIQEKMKKANRIARKKSLDDAEKVTQLMALGYTEDMAKKLLEPYLGSVGFPKFELSNNGATIRRLKKRTQQLEAQAEEEDREYEINGVKVVEDTADRRIRLIFDGKPSPEYRQLLKSHGFKWSRYNNAWQRLLNNRARRAGRELCEQFTGEYEA